LAVPILKIGNMEKDKVTIKIPRPLYDKIKGIITGSGFRSVNEFIVHVLRDLVSAKPDEQSDLRPDEIEVIRRRLKNLGYF
jgi:metal-responsive CopG/Arc/MetJ family transcriptional regulator